MNKDLRIKIIETVEYLRPTEKDQLKRALKNLNQKNYGVYIGSGKRTRFEPSIMLDFKALLQVKETGNDAPRGGQIGNYISFKNTKENRERASFINNYINIV